VKSRPTIGFCPIIENELAVICTTLYLEGTPFLLGFLGRALLVASWRNPYSGRLIPWWAEFLRFLEEKGALLSQPALVYHSIHQLENTI
jgi:hypothetical protein